MNDSNRLLKAARGKPVDKTPIWLMRQAGRYMSEYRALRSRYTILELIKNAELAAEVTLQPISAFDLDAAIIFADLLPPLEGMGLNVEFTKGGGPVIRNPIRTAKDAQRLATPPAEEVLDFTLAAIKLVNHELAGRIPLIGFAGAPFTLSSYAIEGGASRSFYQTKHLMHCEPELWHSLMTKLSTVTANYLKAQIIAGVQLVQIFDSWAGALSPYDYKRSVLSYTAGVVESVREVSADIPIIYFGTGMAGMLPLIKELKADIISLDWRIDLQDAWRALGDDIILQGNLDPTVLCSSLKEMCRQTRHILNRVNGRQGHIFNLGHGILKETPVDHVKALVDFVHEYSPTATSSD